MPTRYLDLITPENRFQLLTEFIGTAILSEGLLCAWLTFAWQTAHFKREMEIIQDPTLQDELSFLEEVFQIEKPLFVPPEDTNENKRKHEENEETQEKGKEKAQDSDNEAKRQKVEDTQREHSQQPGEAADQENGGKCVICWEEAKSVLFLPCKHLCSCKPCSEKTEECPLCRGTIQEKTQVYV